MEKKELKYAVLIDADNVPSKHVKAMMEEIAKYGVPTIKRIYGDWTKNSAAGWKNVLLENAITPIQQYSYTVGKNATDSAMIIDAMDVLYAGTVDGFCIVSSDSDFTKLALRLREAGMKVIGLGEEKTPKPFIAACDKFIYLEILNAGAEPETETAQENTAVPKKKSEKSFRRVDKKTLDFIAGSINDIADDDGWAFLGELGSLLLKKRPDFDPRNYGFGKLSTMLKAQKDKFEIDERDTDRRSIKLVYVRVKK